MLENKDYCDYETCVALVDLGMRITSRKGYSDRNTLKHSSRGITYTVRTASAMGWVIAIPLYEAQKWLREEKHIEVLVLSKGMVGAPYDVQVYTEDYNIGDDKEYSSYEEALSEGIKEAAKILKEEEFHNLRKAFYIDKSIVWIPQGKSHKEYFDSINHSDFIETKVRGYILNDTLSLYKGSDFSIPTKKEVENIVSLFASFNIKQINLGCNIGNIGEVWKPKEIIKLLKEEN